jgi:small nuclear ribonucleoprotein (snRNP)-like protein
MAEQEPADDDLLCFFSELFDPEAALTAPLVEIEHNLETKRDVACFRKAETLDNISACAIVERAPFRPLVYKPRAATTFEPEDTASVGVPGVTGRRRAVRTDLQRRSPMGERATGVLRKMVSQFGANGGPLAFLLACFERSARVRIVLRRTHSLRGFVVGELTAFDKHLNVIIRKAIVHDGDEAPRTIPQLFIRGDNVVAICR